MADSPQWARDRVVTLVNEFCAAGKNRWAWGDLDFALSNTFAKYIAEHEDPPVDPQLLEAREIVAVWYEANGRPINISLSRNLSRNLSRKLREGIYDHRPEVVLAVTALRRGVELAGNR